jgi:hypothetical protein
MLGLHTTISDSFFDPPSSLVKVSITHSSISLVNGLGLLDDELTGIYREEFVGVFGLDSIS